MALSITLFFNAETLVIFMQPIGLSYSLELIIFAPVNSPFLHYVGMSWGSSSRYHGQYHAPEHLGRSSWILALSTTLRHTKCSGIQRTCMLKDLSVRWKWVLFIRGRCKILGTENVKLQKELSCICFTKAK